MGDKVIQKPPSLARQRAQAKSRKRMTAIVASLQSYVASYTKQEGYVDYTDRTLIDDVLYGLGRAIDEKAHSGADGYERFREQLEQHLLSAAGMPLAEVSYRLPDGARIDATKRGSVHGHWAVFKEGRVLHVDGTWQWAKVPTDEAYLRTCRFGTARDAYDAWHRVAVGTTEASQTRTEKRRKAA